MEKALLVLEKIKIKHNHIFSEKTPQMTDEREGIPVSTVTENTALCNLVQFP
jgi:hypothetical protein